MRLPRLACLLIMGLVVACGDGDDDTDVGGDGDADSDSDSDPDAGGDADADSDADGDADTDADSDTDGDTDSDTDGDTDSDADGDTDSDADGDGDGDADSDGDGDADAGEPGTCSNPLPLGLDVATAGTTAGGDRAIDPDCTYIWSDGQPSIAYSVDLPAAGVLTAEVEPADADQDGLSDWEAILSARTDCDDSSSEVACNGENFLEDQRVLPRLVWCATEPGPVTLLVDGPGNPMYELNEGDFTITAHFDPACGDGQVCIDGFGCATDLNGGESCNDVESLELGTWVGGSLIGAATNFMQCDGEHDVTYAVEVPQAGALVYEIVHEPDFSMRMSWFEDCDPGWTDPCEQDPRSGALCLEPGSWTFVLSGYADEFNGVSDEGDFALRMDFDTCDASEVCRDGEGCVPELGAGEACDDLVELPLGSTVGGSTAGMASEFSVCGGDGDPDGAYRLDLPSPGGLTLNLTPGALDLGMQLRESCDAAGTALFPCRSRFTGCLDAGEYALVLDGEEDGAEYSLQADFKACDPGEVCIDSFFPNPCIAELEGGEGCGEPTELPLNGVIAGTTEGHSNDVSTSCAGGGQPDVVYRIVTPSLGYLRTLVRSVEPWELVSALRESCRDADTELGCGSFDGCLEAGSYELIVDGSDEEIGQHASAFTVLTNFQGCRDGERCLSFGFPDPCVADLPGGDSCEDATPVPFGTKIAGDTLWAADDYEFSCDVWGEDDSDVVYRIDVPGAGILTYTVESDPAFVAVGSLRRDCEDAGSELSCWGEEPVCVDAGEYGLIVNGIDGRGNFAVEVRYLACGAGEQCVAGRCVLPPVDEQEPNDEPDSAEVVQDGSTVTGAIGAAGDEDWYAVELAAPDRLVVDLTLACAMDTTVFVYDSLPDPAPEETSCSPDDPAPALACNDDAVADDDLCSYLEVDVVEAGTYYIRVIGYSGDETGDYTLTVGVE
ncbi:MAG: PPC domain-containing protein [Deltaproteobacteria bacterium]|nr:PPC domain-containing protein [Deltaproteobacteria bacterium]